MAGTLCPLSLFAVVLMVFLGKEGSLERLHRIYEWEGAREQPSSPTHLTLHSIILMEKQSTEQGRDWARVYVQTPGQWSGLQRVPKPLVQGDGVSINPRSLCTVVQFEHVSCGRPGNSRHHTSFCHVICSSGFFHTLSLGMDP